MSITANLDTFGHAFPVYYPAVGELPRFRVSIDDAGNVTAATLGEGWNAPEGSPVHVGTVTRCSGYIATPPARCAWEWWPGGGPEGTDEWPNAAEAAHALVDAYAWGTFGDDACEGAA